MSNSISPYSSYNGISGLASGLDTESMVKKALAGDLAKIESIKADKQLTTWKQESYHNIMGKINAFMDEYHDVMNTDTYFFSQKSHKKTELTNASNNATNFINITANSSAVNSSFTVNAIDQLATASEGVSNDKVIGSIKGSTNLAFPLTVAAGSTFGVIVDGEMKQIEIDGTFNNGTELVDALNSKLDQEFGSGKVVASLTAGNELQLEASNSVLQVIDGTSGNNFLNDVGMTNNQLNIVNMYKSIEETFGETETVQFKINDVEFSFDKTTSMKDIMTEINSSNANVVMSYSSLTDKFTITSKNTGETSEINIENTQGNLFGSSSYIKIDQDQYKNGQDAILYIDDPSKSSPIKRSSNIFTVDGITYDLKNTTNEAINFEISQNIDGMVDKIKNYVQDFNNLINDIETKLKEKVYSDFKPLTEDQKNEMSDNQIELWEEKAKSGIHKYDPALTKLVSDLKDAFWSEVEGVSTNLFKAGIQTSTNYNKFELEIDETKLREALEQDAESVWDLFSKDSDIDYTRTLTSDEYETRHKEIGFARRISDVLSNNMSTMRDNQGLKGVLVEIAGLENDASQDTNTLTLSLEDFDDKIQIAIDKMDDREQRLWRKMTAMETALQQMNSQTSWLASQFSQ